MPTTIHRSRGRLNDICGHLSKMSADISGQVRTSATIPPQMTTFTKPVFR
jgi:hypothetical protein